MSTRLLHTKITLISSLSDSGVTTDLASLFIGDENLRGPKLRADLIRSHVDDRREMLATTSEESFEGQGRRVEVDYMFWRVEDLPNSHGSSITCIVSIATSTRQKDMLVQRLVKYLLPNLRRAQGLIARMCKGPYDRSGNPFYDIWFRHVWKLEEYLNSGAKKGDFEPGRNDPRTFDYELSEKKLRNSKTGEKVSETEQVARTREILERVKKTAAETGQVCPTELDCRRYLMASDWSTEEAFTKLRDTLAWRLSTFGVGHPPRGIDPDSITTERRKGVLYPRGRDTHGRPILIFRPRLTEPRERDENEFERYLIYSVERCVSKMVDHGEGSSAPSQLIVLADMSRCGYKNFDVPSTKAIIELLKDRYPERVGLVLVTNLNWAGKQFWNIIRPSLSAETVSKIRLVPRDDPLEYLSRFIEPRHIPAFCGGSDTYVYSIENDDLFSDNEE
ncbi:hypothetical protein FOL47_009026 [Perkinsus chesapeaki]|uniref:CRAL-TRIO domain-containing protein n=1 Tax=Perkinsus chesapeaki TaxID=330153 RepID=A0A7J6LBK8_PERCH|nr:hypothetical protein FOL47_009026 [Perkinsus chesapeaki]